MMATHISECTSKRDLLCRADRAVSCDTRYLDGSYGFYVGDWHISSADME